MSFSIDPSDSTILDKHFSDTIGYTDVPLQPPAPREAWPWGEEDQNGPPNIENDPPSHPVPHSETDAQGSLAVENDDTSNLQSPPSPSPPSQAPPTPPAPPPPPAAPSSQVVDLPLDDIAVGKCPGMVSSCRLLLHCLWMFMLLNRFVGKMFEIVVSQIFLASLQTNFLLLRGHHMT